MTKTKKTTPVKDDAESGKDSVAKISRVTQRNSISKTNNGKSSFY